MFVRLATVVAALVVLVGACSGTSDDDISSADSSSEQGVSFAAPADGDTVSSPLVVEMAARGLEIEAAGEVNDDAGHFHVIVDAGCIDEGETIPAPDDETYFHFGDGSDTAEIPLSPGDHDLCLQLGDGEHTATDHTDELTVTVDDGDDDDDDDDDGDDEGDES